MRATLLVTAMCSAMWCPAVVAQVPAPSLLEVDIENLVEYQYDTLDTARFGTIPNITPSAGVMRMGALLLGDIVAVNGEPAKGTLIGRPWTMDATPNPTPGQAIADTTRGSIGFRTFEILKSDGTPIGTLMILGLNGGTSPPGATFGGQNFAIVGGTGAFLGALGQQGGRQTSQTIPPRAASILEDPANRRRNGGGRVHWLLGVIPLVRPEIVLNGGTPMVAHVGDRTLVSASHPAAPSETLYLFATGLGPTVPPLELGQTFSANPPAVVNSPIKVLVNGMAADIVSAAGFAGTTDNYEVQFRVPPGTATGTASIQVTAAWIRGSAVTIPVR